jgi:hypothetical protein
MPFAAFAGNRRIPVRRGPPRMIVRASALMEPAIQLDKTPYGTILETLRASARPMQS